MSLETGKSLYVGCALTDSPKEFQEDIQSFKEQLRQRNYNVFDFIGLTNGTSADVYNWDIGHCVQDCDAFVAVSNYPSTGLGMEIMKAIYLEKPVLVVAQENLRTTRLLLGAAAVEPTVYFRQYEQLSDVLPLVDDLLGGNLA